MFQILQGSAETLIRSGGKLYHLSIACIIVNSPVKNYQNQSTHTGVSTKNVGDLFMRHSVGVILGLILS